MPSFSEDLREYINSIDAPGPDVTRDEQQTSADFRRFVSILVQSRQTLTTENVNELEDFIQSVGALDLEDLFDEHYTRELLEQIPGFAERTTRLANLLVTNLPSEAVRLYSSEAARCYIFGLWTACVALCRAALDTALRERLDDQTLNSLIETARLRELLDDYARHCAHQVREKGNKALHRESITSGEATEALTYLRRSLLHMYGG